MEKNEIKISIYKGKRVLTLNPESRFPFSFGVSKAKTIMGNIEKIKKFVEICELEEQNKGENIYE